MVEVNCVKGRIMALIKCRQAREKYVFSRNRNTNTGRKKIGCTFWVFFFAAVGAPTIFQCGWAIILPIPLSLFQTHTNTSKQSNQRKNLWAPSLPHWFLILFLQVCQNSWCSKGKRVFISLALQWKVFSLFCCKDQGTHPSSSRVPRNAPHLRKSIIQRYLHNIMYTFVFVGGTVRTWIRESLCISYVQLYCIELVASPWKIFADVYEFLP